MTIAHHALRAGNRGMLNVFLAATFLLGFLFVYLQATEYHHAYTELGLKLGTGIYGSTFFMLTGFHGLHVTLGAIMLFCIWLRDPEGTLHAGTSFRFRSRGLVLALRRRGLARPVHLRLLDLAGYIRDCEKGASRRPFLLVSTCLRELRAPQHYIGRQLWKPRGPCHAATDLPDPDSAGWMLEAARRRSAGS